MQAQPWIHTNVPITTSSTRCPVCPTCAVETRAPESTGAWSEWRRATQEVTDLGALIRSFLEPKRRFSSFVVRRYREQLVAGTNYKLDIQADDFDISFEVYKSAGGAIQLKTPGGLVSLRGARSDRSDPVPRAPRGVCPRKCTNYGRTGQGRTQKVDSCGKYINGFGLCGDANDWGPAFLQNAELAPFVDCTRC